MNLINFIVLKITDNIQYSSSLQQIAIQHTNFQCILPHFDRLMTQTWNGISSRNCNSSARDTIKSLNFSFCWRDVSEFIARSSFNITLLVQDTSHTWQSREDHLFPLNVCEAFVGWNSHLFRRLHNKSERLDCRFGTSFELLIHRSDYGSSFDLLLWFCWRYVWYNSI